MHNFLFGHSSTLYNQDTFYKPFERDLLATRKRVVIESPFITTKRIGMLMPTLSKLCRRGIKVVINTKPLDEHDAVLRDQALMAIGQLQDIGTIVLFTKGHHRKLAIIDDDILYEGSLNILSQNDSCEIMRRINDEPSVREMLRFIRLEKWCK